MLSGDRTLEVQQSQTELAATQRLVGASRRSKLSFPFNVTFKIMQIPDNYIPLVIGYLANIRGGAREASTGKRIIFDDSELVCRN